MECMQCMGVGREKREGDTVKVDIRLVEGSLSQPRRKLVSLLVQFLR